VREIYITPKELFEASPNINTVHAVHKYIKDNDIPWQTKNKRKFLPPSSARSFFEKRGFSYPNLNISFHIIKGGVGKSSLANSCAIRAWQLGAKVLCVDLDQQGNLTSSLGINGRENANLINIVKKEINVSEAVTQIGENFFLIASSMANSRLDQELTSAHTNIGSFLTDTLEDIRDHFDLVIFDCPPTLNKITACATCASDLVLMPLNADPYSMDALQQTTEEIEAINKNFRKDVNYQIVWNKFDQREKLSMKYLAKLAGDEKFRDKVLHTVVRTDATIKNALDSGVSVFEFGRKSNAYEDIDSLTKELLGMGKISENIQ
jgi:chromosome partitioning protein